jgi:hypothetical protein
LPENYSWFNNRILIRNSILIWKELQVVTAQSEALESGKKSYNGAWLSCNNTTSLEMDDPGERSKLRSDEPTGRGEGNGDHTAALDEGHIQETGQPESVV